jgi:Ca2+-transporting ATPase
MTWEQFSKVEESLPEEDFTFVGLIGLIDPPREGVRDSISECKQAGIKVVMITGDHVATASSIAQDLGIIEPSKPHHNRVMSGEELDILSVEAISELRPFPSVFARVRFVSYVPASPYTC